MAKTDKVESWGQMMRNGGGNSSSEPNIEKHGQKKGDKIGPGEAGELRRPGGNQAKGPGEKHGGGKDTGSSRGVSTSIQLDGGRVGGGNCAKGASEKQAKGSPRAKGGKRG